MDFKLLTTEAEIRHLIDYHNLCSEFVVIDTETDSKDPRKANLIDIQMSGEGEESAVMFSGRFLPLLAELRPLQVYHNFKYDWKVMLRAGLDMRGKPMRDTMLLHHLVDETAEHSLDSIVKARWGTNYKEEFWSKYATYQEAPVEERLKYGAADAVFTGRLYRELLEARRAGEFTEELESHVHRLGLALFDTEVAGIRVDLSFTAQLGGELKKEIVETERHLRQLGGYHCEAMELEAWAKAVQDTYTPRGKKWLTLPKPEFNWGSSQQVTKLLYDKLGLPVQKNPKTKKPTADDKALERLGDAHPVLPELRKLRKFSKMHGSFIEGVLERAEGDRIYPSFNVNGTVTGRISHSDPNMGQMPSKGEWVKIRGIFVPDSGQVFGTADYGQIEVCVAAHFSRDSNLLKIVLEGASQHDITAAGLGVPRHVAKTINFAMQYGATKYKIRDILSCSEADAEGALAKYWETYAGLKKFIDWCHGELAAGRPIANPFGRYRRFPKQFASPWELDSAKRQVFSSLIQGTAGDMMNCAFYRTSEEMKVKGVGQALWTIHDEGVFQSKPAQFEEAREILVRNMLQVPADIGLTVPVKVEPSEALERWCK